MKLLLLLSIFALQSPDSVLTEKEAVTLALKNNFDIRLESYQLKIANNNNSPGNAGMLPTVELSGSARQSVQDTEQEFISGDQQSRTGAKTTNYNAGANLNWTIFDGLRMFATKDRLEQIYQTNEFAFKVQVQNAVSDVMKAFYNTALEVERLLLLQSTMQLSDERVKISKNKYELGKASKLEYLQAQVDFNTDQSALIRQQEVIARRKLELIQLIGITGEADDSISLVYDYDGISQLIPLDEVEATAVRQNPDLLLLKSQQEEAMLTAREFERERYPSLDFNLGYNYSNLQAEAGFLRSNRSNGINYGLSATMTLFDGYNQRRNIQNAKVQHEYALTAYQQAEAQLRTSVKAGILALQNARNLVELEAKNLSVADENVEIALERYRVGKSNPLEIREAQNNAVNAQIRYLEALNTAKIAEIELMRLTGLLIQ